MTLESVVVYDGDFYYLAHYARGLKLSTYLC